MADIPGANWLNDKMAEAQKLIQTMKDSGFEHKSDIKEVPCFVGYVPIWSNAECIAHDKGCFGYNKAEFCVSCYSKCQDDWDEWYGCYKSCDKYDSPSPGCGECLECQICDACDSCFGFCDSEQSLGSQETKKGCYSSYGVCEGCESCESCQGCEECQSMDKAEDAQGTLIKNVDESVTRRARGEGYSKAAANMIGSQAGADAAAGNFNALAMSQNQLANSTQADWLTKQGYMAALDQEIKNKEAAANWQKVGGFFF